MNSADCIAKAREVSQLAEEVVDPADRTMLLTVAEAWLELSQFDELHTDLADAMLGLIEVAGRIRWPDGREQD